MFIRVNVVRALRTRGGATVESELEIETAGFKRHARASLAARWDLGGGFGLGAEGGVRHTETGFAPLAQWIEATSPTVALGIAYRNHIDLTWTRNYFGTDDSHWQIAARLNLGAPR
jgi:hypothetical protein